jgi:pilus assembly protein Flp/PilA
VVGPKHKSETQAQYETTTLEEHEMTKLGAFFARLRKDEKGATMIEYSILIGIITVAAIGLIAGMGDYVVDQWTLLDAATNGAGPAPAPAPAPAP